MNPDERSLRRENVGRQWRFHLSTKILKADDKLVGRVAEILGVEATPQGFAGAHSLTWPKDEAGAPSLRGGAL